VIIELPLPDSALLPNNTHGRHHKALSAKRKKAHEYAYTVMKSVDPTARMVGKTPLVITFVHINKRSLPDLDNLLAGSKKYLDGLAAALSGNDQDFEPITIKRDFGPVAKMIIELG
jgi:Holliday junction resolvase RusA-like endonuclease